MNRIDHHYLGMSEANCKRCNSRIFIKIEDNNAFCKTCLDFLAKEIIDSCNKQNPEIKTPPIMSNKCHICEILLAKNDMVGAKVKQFFIKNKNVTVTISAHIDENTDNNKNANLCNTCLTRFLDKFKG